MKITIDIDLSPDEARRFFGLPDLSPAQDLIVERFTQQLEKGFEPGAVPNMMRTMIAGGMQSFEAYQKFVSDILTGATGRGAGDSGEDAAKSSQSS